MDEEHTAGEVINEVCGFLHGRMTDYYEEAIIALLLPACLELGLRWLNDRIEDARFERLVQEILNSEQAQYELGG